jgi:hypothetical protein
MTDRWVRVPEEFFEALSRAGLTSEDSEDEVQDALVGLLTRMPQADYRTELDVAVLHARYSMHVGATRSRIWWSTSCAARRTAAHVMRDLDPTGSQRSPRSDPFDAARLGIDGVVLEAILDLLDGPVGFATVEDEHYDSLRQDSRWQERDGREADEAPPPFAELIRDAQYEGFLEDALHERGLTDVLQPLPEREQILFDLHFGLTTDPIPVDEILEMYDLTPSALKRRIRRALAVLANPAVGSSWDDYVKVEPQRTLPGPVDPLMHLPGLAAEPDVPAEEIVEALWAARDGLHAEDLALLLDGRLDSERIVDVARHDDRLIVDVDLRVTLRPDVQSLAPTVWRWKRPAGERARQAEVAARILRTKRRPMPYAELEDAVGVETTTWNLRNVLTSSPQFNRADRDVFALSHWKHEPYDSIEALMQRFIERNGGEASLEDIIRDLTARFTIKEASIRVYAKSDAFVQMTSGLIRNRREDEPVEETTRPISEIPNCFVKDDRWILRVLIDSKVLRGHSPQIPAGFAHHLKVMRRTSMRLETDIGLQVTVSRKGINDSLGRLRLVAERLNLAQGDLLLIHAPKVGDGPISFSAVAGQELAAANSGRRVTLLLGVEDPSDHEAIAAALGMPLRSRAFAIAGALRARGEPQLASDVLEVLRGADSAGPGADDFAEILGL